MEREKAQRHGDRKVKRQSSTSEAGEREREREGPKKECPKPQARME